MVPGAALEQAGATDGGWRFDLTIDRRWNELEDALDQVRRTLDRGPGDRASPAAPGDR